MSIDRTALVATRNMVPEDHNFILATWLRGLRYGNDWFALIDKDAYFKTYHTVIETMLVNPDITVRLACLKDDQDVILGYSVYNKTRLDFVFVKKAWRGIGIAKSLLPPTVETVSHLTDVGRSILRKYPNIRFNPFDLTWKEVTWQRTKNQQEVFLRSNKSTSPYALS